MFSSKAKSLAILILVILSMLDVDARRPRGTRLDNNYSWRYNLYNSQVDLTNASERGKNSTIYWLFNTNRKGDYHTCVLDDNDGSEDINTRYIKLIHKPV